MPEICRFYGIIIKMYFADHAPPHFHAEYGEDQALVSTKPGSTRLLPANRVYYFGHFLDRDWGNPQLIELSRRVSTWTCPAGIVMARNCFKAVLRRPEESGVGWFWALEWNQCLRVVGGIANSESELPFFEGLPSLDWRALPDGSGRMRREISIKDSEDGLFVWSN